MSKWPLEKIVEIIWDDSNGYAKWGSLEDYLSHSVAECKSIGWLLRENKREVVLVFTQSTANDGDANGTIAIPRGCIVKMNVLRRKDAKT